MVYNVATENNKIYDQLDTLTFMAGNISTEGVGSFINKISSFFASKIAYVREAVSMSANILNRVDNDINIYAQELKKSKKDMLYIVNNLSYTLLENARVMTPVGLDTDLLEACKELKDGLKIFNTDVLRCLEELDMYVSQVLNDKEFRTQTKPQKPEKDPANYATRIHSILNKCVSTKNVEDTKLIKEILPNISSLQKVYEQLMELASASHVNILKQINEYIGSIEAKVAILEKDLTTDMEISKVVLKKLVEDLESNARLVTTSVNMMYFYNQLVLCVNNIIKKFKNMKDVR